MTKFVSTQSHRIWQQGDDRLVFYAGDMLDLDSLSNTINKFGMPDALVSDAEGTVLDLGVPFYFFPALKMGMLNWASQLAGTVDSLDTTLQTDHCFCWSINRKAIDRYLVIKLIEWFGLSAPYTWSGIGATADCSMLFEEMRTLQASWFTDELRCFLLSPIKTSERYLAEPGITKTQNLIKSENGDVLSLWANVQKSLASTCGIYLLTESSSAMAKHYVFSEKTGWALMAGNFPIWAGNYGQAKQASAMGIDVFSDVINHDYQWCDTLIERCYRAIADNIDLLTDLSLVQHLRNQHRARLLENRKWYLGGGLQHYINMQRMTLMSANIEIDIIT